MRQQTSARAARCEKFGRQSLRASLLSPMDKVSLRKLLCRSMASKLHWAEVACPLINLDTLYKLQKGGLVQRCG